MLETIFAGLLTKGGAALLAAAIEGRDLNSKDASSVVTAVLTSLSAGVSAEAAALERIESTLRDSKRERYVHALTAGRSLLDEAEAPHRSTHERDRLLGDARLRFHDAKAMAPTAVDEAEADVLRGLTWLASGSVDDMHTLLAAAARTLEDECLSAFGSAAADVRAHREREQRPLSVLRKAVLGDDGRERMRLVARDSAVDQWSTAQARLRDLQTFRDAIDRRPGWRHLYMTPPPYRGWDYLDAGARPWAELFPGVPGETCGVRVCISGTQMVGSVTPAHVEITNIGDRVVAVLATAIRTDRSDSPDTTDQQLAPSPQSDSAVIRLEPGNTWTCDTRVARGPDLGYAVDLRVPRATGAPLGTPRLWRGLAGPLESLLDRGYRGRYHSLRQY